MTDRPTYQALASYDHLIGPSTGADSAPVKLTDISQTVNAILRVIRDNANAVAPLARHLQGDTPEQSIFNVWHFAKSHLAYKLDRKGFEQIRTPQRTWRDRHAGIDCEDYTIFMASLLAAMGEASRAVLTIISRPPIYGWRHIFLTVLPEGHAAPYHPKVVQGTLSGTALDLLTPYPYPINAIKETMYVQVLSGVAMSGTDRDTQAKENWLRLADPEDRPIIAAMLPHVQRITPAGAIVWKPGAPVRDMEILASDHADEVNGASLSGIGDALKRFKEKQQQKKADKKPSPIQAIGRGVVRVSPIMIAGRGAFIQLVKLNAFNLARKFRIMYLPEDKARKAGLNIDEWRKVSSKKAKIEKTWLDMGGKLEAFKKAISKGAHVPVNVLAGEPVSTATLLVAAAPVVGAMAAIIGKVDFKKTTSGTTDPELEIKDAAIGLTEDGAKLADAGAKLASAGANVAAAIKSNKAKDPQGAAAEAEAAAAVLDIAAGANYGPSEKKAGIKKDPPKGESKFPTAWVIGGLVAAVGIGAVVYNNSNKSS